MARVSVVVPVFHNASSLPELHARLTALAGRNPSDEFEFVYVDDGSRDASFRVLVELARRDRRARIVKLSRNFGSNPAIVAGMRHATGDAVAVVSADLQDPPELIDAMLEHWRSGEKAVLAARGARCDPSVTALAADIFYWMFRAFANRAMPRRGFDFFLLDRQVCDLVRQSRETNLFLPGYILSLGFDPKIVEYVRQARRARFGRSMWTTSKKFEHCVNSFVGCSTTPLRAALVAGFVVSAAGLAYAAALVATRLAYGSPAPGWTSLMAAQLLLSGVQLTLLGVFGEYLWRTLEQARGRPTYIVERIVEHPLDGPQASQRVEAAGRAKAAPANHAGAAESRGVLYERARDVFEGAHVLVTGGLGFLGSNLAIRLVGLGARVTLADAMIPEYGGNLFNISPISDRVTVNFSNICDEHAMNWLVRDKDFVFHLAGQVSHVMSFHNPFPDIDFNIKGTAVLMESLRRRRPSARVVFTGTRGQYGPATQLPVRESAPTNPKGIYEISNLTAEKIIQVYNDVHGVASVMLRLTNVYGPRAQMKHSHYGVVNWFVRLILEGKTLPIFGDGRVRRDFLFVDDCVDAILACAVHPDAYGEILNVGNDQAADFLDVAETLIRVNGGGRWEYAPFTPERLAQEPGDFVSDVEKIRKLVGWAPTTRLEEGLRATLEYYRLHRSRYWTSDDSVDARRAA
jgi:UDP-glucose 4-epimerase